ncbi:MAG: ComEC/Rec2 family competence protein [Candidatus Eisenbacteria bacterium]
MASLAVAAVPAFLLALETRPVAPFAACGAVGAVAFAAAAASLRRHRRRCDALILLACAALAFGVGATLPRPAPLPHGLPPLVLHGRVVAGSSGMEARDVAMARDGRWLPIPGRFRLLGGSMGGEATFLGEAYLDPLVPYGMPGLADPSRGARWDRLRGTIRLSAAWSDSAAKAGWEGIVRRAGRHRLASRIGSSLPADTRAFVPILVWGEDAEIPLRLERIFRATGTMHLIAISGLHVSLVAVLLEALLRLVLHRPALRWMAIAATLFAYAALVGPIPSVVRSVVMALAITGARALGRPGRTGAAWWAALLLVAFVHPGELARAGALLSFAGTAALILSPRVASLGGALSTSAIAVLATTGILGGFFGQCAPFAVVANLVGVPAFAPALVSILWGLAWGNPETPWLQAIAWGPARILTEAWIRPLAALVPAGEATQLWVPCGMGRGIASTLVFLALLAASSRSRAKRMGASGHVARAAPWLWLAAAILSVPAICATRNCRLQPPAAAEAWILPVGQGDATLVRTAAGENLLIDTGPGGTRGDLGARRLAPSLRALGARHLRGVLLTHPDEDHAGGLHGLLLAGIRIDTLYVSASSRGTVRLPRSRAPPVRALAAPWSLRAGPLAIRLLAPASGEPPRDGNASSLVLRIEGPGGSLAIAGDLPVAGERSLLSRIDPGTVDVLLAGHHGSGGSTGEAWLDRLEPRLVLVSCGAHNRYGHPSPAMRARCATRGIPLARTDRDGALRLRWEGGRLLFGRGGCRLSALVL